VFRAVPRPATAAVAAALLTVLAVAAGVRLGPLAGVLAVPAALAAALLRARGDARARRLRRESREDALTGVGNRLLLAERLEYELVRHRRHERPLAVLAMDLDGFKAVNDRFGHAAGDEVLVEVARALCGAVREQDTVVRLGGDEFCVLAPESDRYATIQLAERLRRAVQEAVDGLGPLRASVGFALFPHDARSAQQLLAHADAAAMADKRRDAAPAVESRRRAA
jgi:diguanylate cyclase (GGDEF)-like protein